MAVLVGGSRGDRQFDDLVRQHRRAVTAYARATARDAWTAEDAVQETFLRAWKYFDSYRASGSFEGWLIRICRNCLIDFANRQAPEPIPRVPESVIGPDHSQDVYDLLHRLSLPQREVVVLCGLLGYEYREAAEVLGIAVGTVRSRLHRARATMAAELESDTREVSA